MAARDYLRGARAWPLRARARAPDGPRGHSRCRRYHHLRGVIASAGFASGHRVVVGHWDDSPLGPMTDVMWARPGGERVLLVDRPAAAQFITAVYRFDRVEVVPVTAGFDGRRLVVVAGGLELWMEAGRGWRLPLGDRRPAWFTRWVEAAVARPLLGVRTYGVSPTGVREWYRADEYRRVVGARAELSGHDLGRLRPVEPAVGFGFSEPPRRPSIVRVRPLLQDPSGRLDQVVDRLAGQREG